MVAHLVAVVVHLAPVAVPSSADLRQKHRQEGTGGKATFVESKENPIVYHPSMVYLPT